MSEVSDIIGDIVDDRAPGTTTPVLNLNTGRTFAAEIDGNVDPVVILSELGEDIREATLLHVTNDADAAAISENDLVRFTLYGATTVNRVIKRRNNPGSPQTDFWVTRKTEKDA